MEWYVKNQFFISSEPVELYGVNGWYVDLEFSRFRRPEGTEFQIRVLERQDVRTIPVIAMTANAFADDRQKTVESGMNIWRY
ncbi:hypothetical protein [Hungatella sp. SB206]|uniref:hypothetical protein n=1 Tax=Hungatella sp. SB206 TaxID=2937758 RepID=UPI003DA8683E